MVCFLLFVLCDARISLQVWRFSLHKSNYKGWLIGNGNYVTSYEILKYDDAYIELFEKYPCESKEQLLKRKGEVIRTSTDAVNKNLAGRTKPESDKAYYNANKHTII